MMIDNPFYFLSWGFKVDSPLLKDRAECEERLKSAFPGPKDMRRIKEINSLLLTNGETDKLSFIGGSNGKP